MATTRLTEMQLKILNLLGDGKGHTPQEVRDKCMHGYGPVKNVRNQMALLRKHLRPHNQDITCTTNGSGYVYTWVKVIPVVLADCADAWSIADD